MLRKWLTCLGTMILVSSTYANPVGGTVSNGSAAITAPDTNTVVITQTSDKAILNWESFNIGEQETTRFVQPSTSAIALNRINPQQGASEIFGQLQANGRIILINQAGIHFGPNSTVNVAGIIASTVDMTDSNFMAGQYNFDQSILYNGSIINEGTIIAAQHGLVALIGSAVSNEGLIKAHLGNVVLASGSQFTVGLDDTGLINFAVNKEVLSPGVDSHNRQLPYAVNNSGTITADGGTILLTAKAAEGVVDRVINMTGVLQARSVHKKNGTIILQGSKHGVTYVSGYINASGKHRGQTGGTVKILGNTVVLDGNAVVNVSGDRGGGSALIGGNFHGAGPEQNAQYTYIGNDVRILADALTQGDGGNIAVWSDKNTYFHGSISARGGINGGNGGFVETSGQYLNVNGSFVDLRAPLGTTGTWLLDPTNIYIATDQASATAAGMSGTDDSADTSPPPTFEATGSVQDSLLTINTLTTALDSADILVTTTNPSGTGDGNIIVVDPITWASSKSLTLTADKNINLNASITPTGGGGLTLNANNFVFADGVTITGNIVGNIAGLNNTLDLSAYTTPVSVNIGTGTATGIIGGAFSNINTFVGSAAAAGADNVLTDNLVGGNTWTIFDSNTGTINNTINFNSFGNLNGGVGDHFMIVEHVAFPFIQQGSANSISATSDGILDYSGTTLSSVSVNLGNASSSVSGAPNVNSFSGITTFIGNNSSSTLDNSANNGQTWNITDNNAGTIVGTGNTFSGFNNLIGGSGDSFVLADGKQVDSITATNGTLDYRAYTTGVSIDVDAATATTGAGTLSFSGITQFYGGSGSNTFIGSSASDTWNITGSDTGTISGDTFNGFGNLVGSSAHPDTFIFSNNATISGSIDGGNPDVNILDFSGYSQGITLTLSIPAPGDGFNTGSVATNTSVPIIGSFANIRQLNGSTTYQSTIVLPNKPNISIVYTNPEHTAGYIDDPFTFSNATVVNATPTPPTPVEPSVVGPIPEVAQIITPFTQQSSASSDLSSFTTALFANAASQSTDEIIQLQKTIDQEIADSLSLNCPP